jgi:DtxR family Mn-dependent transcriptional regulator
MTKQQTARTEDYLKTIASIGDDNNTVSVTEISQALGVKKPSVTAALKKLSRQGLVEHERYGRVALTPEGSRIAQDVIRRHEVLCCFLVNVLHVDSEIAIEDACQMEHVLSMSSLEGLENFVEYVQESISVYAYCFKCRAKKEIKNVEQVTLKNGRKATQGICPACGTKMFKMG